MRIRLLLLALFSSAALFSASAFAHGHYPQTVGPKYVLSKVYNLEFNLGNHFKQKTCFDIEVNGKIFAPYGVCLRAGQTKKMSVWLPSQPDTETTNVVCSIAKNKGSINTRMCTTAKTVFPLSKLKGKSWTTNWLRWCWQWWVAVQWPSPCRVRRA